MTRACQYGKKWVCFVGVVLATIFGVESVHADAFTDYQLSYPNASFTLPGSYPVFDVLNDGRLVTLTGDEVFVEDDVGTRTFTSVGELPNADVPSSYYSAFLRVSPDGTQIAVGNNGGASYANFQVGLFDLADLDAGQWFPVNHYDAEWIDSNHLAMAAGAFGGSSVVTALDTTGTPQSFTNPTIITNIDGASAGVTFDSLGNLYTANGFDYGAGGSDTGWIKAFGQSEWTPALTGQGGPADFEATGVLIADVLSAAALGFDGEGNLHVGGGDSFGGSGDYGYAGLVRHTEVADALGGGGPADPTDPLQVRKFDPVGSGSSLYDCNYNGTTGELYFRAGTTVYSYVVPEPASLALLAVGMMIVLRRRVR